MIMDKTSISSEKAKELLLNMVGREELKMDKQKLVKAVWLSVTVLIIAIDANLLFIGFNNLRQDSYTIIVLALCLLPALFFCAYKGIKYLLESILLVGNFSLTCWALYR